MQKIWTIAVLLVSFHVDLLLIAQPSATFTAAAVLPIAEFKNPENQFLKYVEECLAIIENEANKIPMTGVAMAAYIPGDTTRTWISKMKVVGKLADAEVNLLGIVYTKASEMAVTHKNSGNADRKDMRGEYGYEGGVIKKVKSGYLVCAFSGGKGEDDVYAARKGLDWLAAKFD